MKGKDALDPFAIGDAADGEGFVEPAPFAADHDAGKNLNALLVALDHARMNMHAVAHGKLHRLGPLLFLFNRVDDAAHKSPYSPAGGRTFSSKAIEIANESPPRDARRSSMRWLLVVLRKCGHYN